jgi:hypothetical protein
MKRLLILLGSFLVSCTPVQPTEDAQTPEPVVYRDSCDGPGQAELCEKAADLVAELKREVPISLPEEGVVQRVRAEGTAVILDVYLPDPSGFPHPDRFLCPDTRIAEFVNAGGEVDFVVNPKSYWSLTFCEAP